MPFLGGGFGSYEMIIFATIALLLFGKRLPEVARSVGSSLMEFKRGMQGVETEIRSAGDNYSATQTDTAASRPAVPDDQAGLTDAPRFELPAEEEV